MLCAGCLSSDWLLTERLSEIQSAFTSALLQQMFTEIIITNANCPVKDKKKKTAEDNLKHFSYFSRKECFTIHANCLLCMKCQTRLYQIMSSKFGQKVVTVKGPQ